MKRDTDRLSLQQMAHTPPSSPPSLTRADRRRLRGGGGGGDGNNMDELIESPPSLTRADRGGNNVDELFENQPETNDSTAIATMRQRLAELEPGQSAVVEVPKGYYVLRLLERRAAAPAPFEEVRELVRAEYLRACSEAEVRELLEVARKQSEIRGEPGP